MVVLRPVILTIISLKVRAHLCLAGAYLDLSLVVGKGGASPHPQCGTGASGGGVAPGCELARAIRVPHSTYATNAERNSGSSGSPAGSALAAISAAQRDRCSSVSPRPRRCPSIAGYPPRSSV